MELTECGLAAAAGALDERAGSLGRRRDRACSGTSATVHWVPSPSLRPRVRLSPSLKGLVALLVVVPSPDPPRRRWNKGIWSSRVTNTLIAVKSRALRQRTQTEELRGLDDHRILECQRSYRAELQV
jgi:hypothetical protein